jgi:Cof subfamily protein (haloacid dehalogenase superfamily)
MANAQGPIRLFIADVDGTLVTHDKQLTPATLRAVETLRRAGVAFAITSGRPPRGMSFLAQPLGLDQPMAAFNGGQLVQPGDLTILEEHALPPKLVPEIITALERHQLDVWLYAGEDWYLHDPAAPHVAKESATVRFSPTVVKSYDGLVDRAVKVVGVSDDLPRVAAAEAALREAFGDRVSAARSQPYYVDVTHPSANKAEVVHRLAARLKLREAEIATIGDMPNDVLMFAVSGLSIAMGQSTPEVQRCARQITTGNDDEGFAHAVERFILPHAPGRR